MTEQEARDLIAKALEAEGWPNTALSLRNGGEAYMRIAIRALLPLLATSELERRALAACEEYARQHPAWRIGQREFGAENDILSVGREAIEAEKPKGPWVVTSQGNVAAHVGGRSVAFWDNRKGFDNAACAAFVAEQNAKEVAR